MDSIKKPPQITKYNLFAGKGVVEEGGGLAIDCVFDYWTSAPSEGEQFISQSELSKNAGPSSLDANK